MSNSQLCGFLLPINVITFLVCVVCHAPLWACLFGAAVTLFNAAVWVFGGRDGR